jgi:zinc transport system substrate-binding protein
MQAPRSRRPGLAAALAAGWLAASAGAAEPVSAPLRVATSVEPQRYFVERIGGRHVEVVAMIPPGAGETFEPTLAQLAFLQRASVYVKLGHPAFPFESTWLAGLLADTDGILVVGGAQDPGTASGDPHVWLVPRLVKPMARAIEAGLAERRPELAGELAANRARFEAEIDALDAELRELLADKRGSHFLVVHPAWGHFAQEYGLVQLAVEREGREPDPKFVADLLSEARRDGIRTVLTQREASDAIARTLAAELGAEVVVLDPLAYDWPDSLRRGARAIAAAAVP